MLHQEITYRIFQEVGRRTAVENKNFDQVFYQLPEEYQRLIDERLGALLEATIRETYNIASMRMRR